MVHFPGLSSGGVMGPGPNFRAALEATARSVHLLGCERGGARGGGAGFVAEDLFLLRVRSRRGTRSTSTSMSRRCFPRGRPSDVAAAQLGGVVSQPRYRRCLIAKCRRGHHEIDARLAGAAREAVDGMGEGLIFFLLTLGDGDLGPPLPGIEKKLTPGDWEVSQSM